MWSTSMSALEPSSVTICPLTETRPPEIIFSALRREVIPAAEMIFCKRSEGMYREGYQELTGGRLRLRSRLVRIIGEMAISCHMTECRISVCDETIVDS